MIAKLSNRVRTFGSLVEESLPPDMTVDAMDQWARNPIGLQNVLRDALFPPTLSQVIPRWLDLEIGGVSKKELLRRLDNGNFVVTKQSREMILHSAFRTLRLKKVLRLAHCPVGYLGFAQKPTITQVQERIVIRGGLLCPPEVGPHLRLLLKDRHHEQRFFLIMKQIVTDDGKSRLFNVNNHNEQDRFHGNPIDPDTLWDFYDEVVFVLPDES